jgi:RHS repeat-associated protein
VKFGFGEEIVIEEDGYIYIWVSNESQSTRVWFDDLTITHEQNLVVQASDYGVWGDLLREQRSDDKKYRFGYQGQFAEKDEETGWNHFELREYDAKIGRHFIADPYRQFQSPYSSMANTPVQAYDIDGGWVITGWFSALAMYKFAGVETGVGIAIDHNGEIAFLTKTNFFVGAGMGVEVGYEAEMNFSSATIHDLTGFGAGEVGVWDALGVGALGSVNPFTGEVTLSGSMWGAGGGVTFQIFEAKKVWQTFKPFDSLRDFKDSDLDKFLQEWTHMNTEEGFAFIQSLKADASKLIEVKGYISVGDSDEYVEVQFGGDE